MFNIAFVIRASAAKQKGGDFFQAQETAKELRALGVNVDLFFSGDSINYKKYNALHFFNIIRPSDILRHTKKSNIPYFISTVFVEYPTRLKFLSFFIEYCKTILRPMLKKDLMPCRQYILLGQKKSMKIALDNAKALFPNSYSEQKRLEKKMNQEFKNVFVINNGINTNVFKMNKKQNTKEKFILSVGRIEPIKNQLNLIRAAKNLDKKLIIVGNPSSNKKYYKKCLREANDNVTFIPFIDQSEIAKYYNQATLHVLPSYFETTGLVSLEAAACGCNIIVTEKGDQREYYKEIALFCNPDNISSIEDQISILWNKKRNYFNQSILVAEKFSWKQSAFETLKVYKSLL